MAINKFGKSLLNNIGQGGFSSSGNQNSRNVYPAIVINTDDPTDQGRIKARIIELDKDGKQRGGRDRDILDDKLPFCVPMIPFFFHARPDVGEMVYVILENPSDNSAPRYWIGPIITSKIRLDFQAYEEAVKVFDYTDFAGNANIMNDIAASVIFPQSGDVALQGRDDSDIILRPREVYISAGKFKKGDKGKSFEPNIEAPALIQLKQFDFIKENESDEGLSNFSQINQIGTNINLYSPRGKFRKPSQAALEDNKDLKDFGNLANSLHPVVFGDELVKLLDLIIKTLLNHIHQPQNPLVPISESDELKAYTIDGKLQNLISNHIRVN